MFSVIIPLYNKAAYVQKAIQSVLAQTCQEFELIVVDDGSTDNPLPVNGGSMRIRLRNLEQLVEKITLIKQNNQGVSIARNNGVKVAKYEYIAFLDADDWWESTYLEEMKVLIEKYPDAGIYGSSYYKVKKGKLIPANIGVEAGFEKGLINYCQVYAKTMYMPLTSITSIIKKTVFDSERGFKVTLKMGEDFDLWLRLALKYPVAFLNKPLAYYNQDVELADRAIGEKLYEPSEHMLFSNYDSLQNNNDFQILFESLAVYGLLPYFVTGKNKKETDSILSGIHWENHSFKYRLYYRILPKILVSIWMKFLKFGSKVKKLLLIIIINLSLLCVLLSCLAL